MAALIAVVAICLFAVGVVVGITGVLAVAIHREERGPTLTTQAPDNVTRAGRWLTGLNLHARTAIGDRENTPV